MGRVINFAAEFRDQCPDARQRLDIGGITGSLWSLKQGIH